MPASQIVARCPSINALILGPKDTTLSQLHRCQAAAKSVSQTCGAGDGFIHDGAAHVVAAGAQQGGRPLGAHLHPGRLDVFQGAAKCQPRHRMHQEALVKRGASPRSAYAQKAEILFSHAGTYLAFQNQITNMKMG